MLKPCIWENGDDYAVDGFADENGMPLFNMEQVHEIAMHQTALVCMYEGGVPEQYACIKVFRDLVTESYFDGTYCIYEPQKIDSVDYYGIGAYEWDWRIVDIDEPIDYEPVL